MFAPESAKRASGRSGGLCFNEAGACLPRKFANGVPELFGKEASMRPGHVCPGKRRWQRRGDQVRAASMRPGHVCPGKPEPEAEPKSEPKLQ